MSFLIGAGIGALLGLAIIGICECIKIAVDYFQQYASVSRIDVIKKDCTDFDAVLRSNSRIRAAVNGETTGLVLLYENGELSRYATVEKELSEEFNGCSGYRVYRHDQETAHKIY